MWASFGSKDVVERIALVLKSIEDAVDGINGNGILIPAVVGEILDGVFLVVKSLDTSVER